MQLVDYSNFINNYDIIFHIFNHSNLSDICRFSSASKRTKIYATNYFEFLDKAKIFEKRCLKDQVYRLSTENYYYKNIVAVSGDCLYLQDQMEILGASGSKANRIFTYNINNKESKILEVTGKTINKIIPFKNYIYYLSKTPNKQAIIIKSGNYYKEITLPVNQQILFDVSNDYILISEDKIKIKMHEPRTGNFLDDLFDSKVDEDLIFDFKVNKDNSFNYLLAACQKTIYIINLTTKEIFSKLDFHDFKNCQKYEFIANYFYVATEDVVSQWKWLDGEIKEINQFKKEKLNTMTTIFEVDRTFIYIAKSSNEIEVWDTEKSEHITDIRPKGIKEIYQFVAGFDFLFIGAKPYISNKDVKQDYNIVNLTRSLKTEARKRPLITLTRKTFKTMTRKWPFKAETRKVNSRGEIL